MRERFLIVALALAAFGAALGAGLYLDDLSLAVDPVITSPNGWWESFGWRQTRPLTWFSYWLNYHWSGENPAPYHAVNLLLHVICVLLVYDTLRGLVPSNAALIAAGLFAIHPIQTEAVVYIFARATLLMTLFCLLSLRAWLRGRYWWACFWFVLALASKEECAAFPLFLILLHISRGSSRKEIPAIGAMLLFSLVAGLRVIYLTTLTAGSGAGSQAGISPFDYFWTQGVVLWRYVRMLAVPYGFSIDSPVEPASAGWGLTGWVMTGACVFLATRRFGNVRQGFWIIAALVLIAPSSTILPAQDLAADRRLYLPMVAIGAAIGLWLEARPRWIALALGIGLVLISFRQTLIWSSAESLWREAMRLAPGKIRPRIQLARQLPPAAALPILDDAQKLAPRDANVASERGRVFLELGDAAAALGEFGRALALAPGDARAMNNRGVALLRLKQGEAAAADFHRALDRDPCLFDARWNLRNLGDRSQPPAKNCRFTPREIELLAQTP